MLTEEAAICPFSSLLGVKGSHIGTEQKQPGVFWMESHPLTSRRVCWPVGSYLEAGCGGPPQEIWPLCGALPPGDLNFLGRERALHPPADGEYEDWGGVCTPPFEILRLVGRGQHITLHSCGL